MVSKMPEYRSLNSMTDFDSLHPGEHVRLTQPEKDPIDTAYIGEESIKPGVNVYKFVEVSEEPRKVHVIHAIRKQCMDIVNGYILPKSGSYMEYVGPGSTPEKAYMFNKINRILGITPSLAPSAVSGYQ